MNETLLLTIEVIIVLGAFLIGASHLGRLIGQGVIYSDQEKRTQLNICLEQNIKFQECYHGIYDRYAIFEAVKN
jgi:hypothetical protein